MSDDENEQSRWNYDLDDLDPNLFNANSGADYTSELGTDFNTNSRSLDNIRSDVSNINSKMEQYNEQMDQLDTKIERYNKETNALAEVMRNFQNNLEDTEEHLSDMSETLESRELNIYLVPPDTDISRLALQVQIVLAAFVVVIALGGYIIPDSPFTYIGIALSFSILVNLLTRAVYPIRHSG